MSDALDQIREHLEEIRSEIGWALAHEHAIKRPGQLWIEERIETSLALLVGVGCGNAKKDTP